MAKRVYELAKELGLESKALVSWLKDNGEFVRSASSTVEMPVERKVRAAFPDAPAGGAAKAAKPAKKAAAAEKAAPAKATAAQVVVIPDRGKFHVETCRFVKGVPGTVTLTKTAAKRQGYTPCGVCKPA